MPRKKKTVVVNPEYIDLESLTTDPTLVIGRVWFRSDLGRIKYSPDGTTTIELPYPTTYTKLAEVNLAAGSTYSITDKGLMSIAVSNRDYVKLQYYHSGQSAWYNSKNYTGVSDGANIRLENLDTTATQYAVIAKQYLGI